MKPGTTQVVAGLRLFAGSASQGLRSTGCEVPSSSEAIQRCLSSPYTRSYQP